MMEVNNKVAKMSETNWHTFSVWSEMTKKKIKYVNERLVKWNYCWEDNSILCCLKVNFRHLSWNILCKKIKFLATTIFISDRLLRRDYNSYFLPINDRFIDFAMFFFHGSRDNLLVGFLMMFTGPLSISIYLLSFLELSVKLFTVPLYLTFK